MSGFGPYLGRLPEVSEVGGEVAVGNHFERVHTKPGGDKLQFSTQGSANRRFVDTGLYESTLDSQQT